MDNQKLLFDRIVTFQRTIADLDKTIADQEIEMSHWQRDLFEDLFATLDAFENLEKIIAAKSDSVDKSTRSIFKSVVRIKRKLLRILKKRDIEPLIIPDNHASMELCKVVATENSPELDNGSIIAIEKPGYINTRKNLILRKAEVLTVLNRE
ncbi:MAG: nucleotide exchange factor GrpE [Thermodesulfobacteriota bacterium]|nr:nucleotide exchange factor GrpE [Thermodesulfobacteriota bacterium]